VRAVSCASAAVEVLLLHRHHHLRKDLWPLAVVEEVPPFAFCALAAEVAEAHRRHHLQMDP
jgi:hypothetical protein